MKNLTKNLISYIEKIAEALATVLIFSILILSIPILLVLSIFSETARDTLDGATELSGGLFIAALVMLFAIPLIIIRAILGMEPSKHLE